MQCMLQCHYFVKRCGCDSIVKLHSSEFREKRNQIVDFVDCRLLRHPPKITMTAADFAGKYKLAESDNFDEFMCALGVGFFLRKVGNKIWPELHVEVKDDHCKFTSVSTFKTTVLEFDLGKEFQTTTPDDRKVKSIVNLEDGKLVQKEYPIEEGAGEEKNTEYIRELDADKNIVVNCLIRDVKCRRLYKRLPAQ